jgi:hypothetical protein
MQVLLLPPGRLHLTGVLGWRVDTHVLYSRSSACGRCMYCHSVLHGIKPPACAVRCTACVGPGAVAAVMNALLEMAC